MTNDIDEGFPLVVLKENLTLKKDVKVTPVKRKEGKKRRTTTK